MSETRWVQYKNDPNGTRWKVLCETNLEWQVEAIGNPINCHWLPKSDYPLCPAPERWERVEMEISSDGSLLKYSGYSFPYALMPMHRWVKTEHGYIIERKVG